MKLENFRTINLTSKLSKQVEIIWKDSAAALTSMLKWQPFGLAQKSCVSDALLLFLVRVTTHVDNSDLDDRDYLDF